jgi:hypothetical protein
VDLDKRDLEWLKEQPEWNYVVGYLRKGLFEVQESMTRSGMQSSDLVRLSAQGEMLTHLLDWASTERKKSEE